VTGWLEILGPSVRARFGVGLGLWNVPAFSFVGCWLAGDMAWGSWSRSWLAASQAPRRRPAGAPRQRHLAETWPARDETNWPAQLAVELAAARAVPPEPSTPAINVTPMNRRFILALVPPGRTSATDDFLSSSPAWLPLGRGPRTSLAASDAYAPRTREFLKRVAQSMRDRLPDEAGATITRAVQMMAGPHQPVPVHSLGGRSPLPSR
jgi:hypothetical protein